ncbi:hypothetical protein CLOM_g18349 [Closterium sp. NIES-68]|nr:hypothetical protein CLOM_g18349 [Closterium sp. NIES-68]
MASFSRSFPSSSPLPRLLRLLPLLAFLAVVALPCPSRACYDPPWNVSSYSYSWAPPSPVVPIAESDRAAMRAVYAALPPGLFFWNDFAMSKPTFLDANRTVSSCCVQACGDQWCPLVCTPDGRITGMYADPIVGDMPGGAVVRCPPGGLSPAVGDLAELSSLILRHSCLSGELPDSVSRLQKLTEVVMAHNSFSGSIPPGLFRLPALRLVDLSANSGGFSGSLPDGPDAYSPSLETVLLANNTLSGELPRALLRAPALRWADLQGNNFTGELPGEAGAHSLSIEALLLRNNSLSGGIPASLTEMTALKQLDLGGNRFSGAISPGLFRLPALRRVDLSGNGNGGLSGSLPDGPGSYSPSLETVLLAGNALSGELPRALLRAPALRRAELQSNNFTGELPGEAGAYSRSIEALLLRDNSLSGGLPTALAEMARLEMLDLGGNRLSGAVPQALGALLPVGLDVVRLDGNALTGPLCHALLPARDLALGFNPHLGGDSGEGGKGSLHGCVLPPKLEVLSAPHAGLWGSVPPDLFLAADPQTGRRPAMGGYGKIIELNFSRNSLSGSLSAFSVLPSGALDLSHNNFSGGIPEAFFSKARRVDVRFNALSGPLYDARRGGFSEWDYLRVSNNSAAMARAVGAGYLPAPSPGVQASAAEMAALLAVRDALLGGAARGASGGAAGGAAGGALSDGGNSSWAALLSGWGKGTSSACAWYGVGCTADGHVDTLHLLGDQTVTLHAPFVPESPECEYDAYGRRINNTCAHDPPPPPPPVRFFLQGLPARKGKNGRLSVALGQLTRLTSLRISHHTLSGSLPASLSLLSRLVSLDLSSNRHLSGAIPPALYALPSLQELTLRGNTLTGAVLPSTTPAAALSPWLESLDVGGNQLLGTVAASISTLTALTRLALDGNRLQGSIPRQLGALWMLRDLQLQGNALQGDISVLAATFAPAAAAASGSSPHMWGLGGVFPLLTSLDVSHNQLSGDAAALAPLQKGFRYLNASHNELTCSPGSALWNAQLMDLSHNRISTALDDLVPAYTSRASVLRLAHNQISGSIPHSLLRQTVGDELDLSHNLLSGTLPLIWSYYWMTTLDLSHNQLSGPILEIGRELRRCNFSHNQLTGGIPEVPPALEQLDVSWNQLSEVDALQFKAADHLRSLDLSHNAIAGGLPALGDRDQLTQLTRLTYLDLSFNAFSGSLAPKKHLPFPASVAAAAASGAEVRLSHNALAGSIPASVFSPCLALLELSHNNLSGPIPAPLKRKNEKSFLLPLSHLDLSSNEFTGSISNSLVASLTALTHLDLSRNKLKGSLPALCGGQQRLATLLLSSNAFSGPLSSLLSPSSPCTSSLLSLNISSNQISGALPSSLSRYTALQSLLAARNRMSGRIPAGVASLKALQALDLSWNGLSGAIPALLRAAAPSLHVQLAGNALSGSVPQPLSDLPLSCFRPGNPKLCGTPLPACKTSKLRKGRW